jgi:hypothetical protein
MGIERMGQIVVRSQLQPLRLLAVALLAGWSRPAAANAQPDNAEHQSRWEFTEQFVRDTWTHPIRMLKVTIGGAGPVHGEPDDCEIHIGAALQDPSISDFEDVVLEPPNVCKDSRRSLSAWRTFYQGMAGELCEAEGFLRAWPEHLTSGSGASNPNHIMEMHPLRQLTCPGGQVELRDQLAAHADLGYKTGAQIETVLRTFRLWVRRTHHTDGDALNTVEFDYFACTHQSSGDHCGFGPVVPNFGRLKVQSLENTKRCSGGGANGEEFRTIIGRAKARGRTGAPVSRAHLTKLYALPGTNFYSTLGSDCSPPGPPSKQSFDVLGIFTIDPLAVTKTLDRIAKDGLDQQWVEVAFPVAFIIFGEMP